ncbi:MAG: heavy-metal-associated domain-containing protein [Thermoflavifilum sp.]|nr:heavy-metal-associated domain-containing protein [Thermoflavifilum sp.]
MQVKIFQIQGMHCAGCVENVKQALQNIPGVIDVQVSLSPAQAVVSMEEELPLSRLQEAVSQKGRYSLSELVDQNQDTQVAAKKPSFFQKWFSHKKSCCQ